MARSLVPPISFVVPASSSSTGGPHDEAPTPSSLSSSWSSAPVVLSPAGKPCVICFDMERDGVVCTENHFVCRGCLQGFIRNLEPITIRRSGGCVSCPAIDDGQACEADPWSYDDLVNLLDPSTQRMYVQRLEGLLASVLSAETATSGKPPRSPYRGSIGGNGRRSRSISPVPPSSSSSSSSSSIDPADIQKLNLRNYRQYIAEEILTLKCPREGCRRAFLDFDGCFALTCPGCGCGFCAACIKDCGDDAHEHCKEVHKGLFGTLERFNQIQRHRRLAAVTGYLTSVVCVQESVGFVLDQLLVAEGAVCKDLEEVGIGREEVLRVLGGGKLLPLEGEGSVLPAAAAAAAAAGAEKAAVAVRLEANDDNGREREGGFWARVGRRFRWVVNGPGYAAEEEDGLSQVLGTVVSASLIVAGVWWSTGNAEEEQQQQQSGGSSNESTRLFMGLVLGPAMILLLSGRGKQLLQSVYVALLTALVALPLYHFSEPLITFVVMILVHILSVAAHILGMLLDLTMEGARLSQILLIKLSTQVKVVSSLIVEEAPWVGEGAQVVGGGVKAALSSLGLLPPGEMELERATF